MEVVGRKLTALWHACARIKTGNDEYDRRRGGSGGGRRRRRSAGPAGADVRRYRSASDMLNVALVGLLPVGAFVAAGQAVSGGAGPSAVLSATLAALAAILSGRLTNQ